MVSYETVKYFNAEAYEFKRYCNAVKKFQDDEWKVLISLNAFMGQLQSLLQSAMIHSGLQRRSGVQGRAIHLRESQPRLD